MNIAWIGTGIMGLAMAGHLQKAGHKLTIYTRTKQKAKVLLDAGATWAENPMQAAKNSDIIFSIVGYPTDVEEVILGEFGALNGIKEGAILCDMTTSCPELAVKIATKARKKNCFSLDAPVTGGDIGAKNGTLSIFVGGEKSAFDKALPCFEAMGGKILHCGTAGMGQKAKLGNQIAVAGLLFSVCESITFAQEAGLDINNWLETVEAGAAGSNQLSNVGRRIINNDFAPGFFVEHFLKDLCLCIKECQAMNLELPGLILAEKTYRKLVEKGYAKDGTQVLAKALSERNI